METNIDYNKETKVISRREKLKIPNVGLGQRFFKSMQLNKNSIAQIDAATGKFITFGKLLEQSIRTAIKMQNLGLKSGDIISICSYNQLYSIVPFIAAQFLGVIVAPIDPTIEVQDIKHLLNIVQPVLIFISDNCEEWIKLAANDLNNTTIIAFSNSIKFYKFDTFLKPRQEENDFEPYIIEDGNKTAIILFSSGTTGLPKGICLSHNNVFINYLNFVGTFSKADVILSYASLYWISTILLIVYQMEENSTRILCNKFDSNLFWKYVEKFNIDLVMLPPSQAVRVYKVKPENCVFKSLKLLLIGGSTISSIYVDLIRKSLPHTNVLVGYGLTEMGVVLVSQPNNELHKRKPCTIGHPVPEIYYKIVDIDTEEPLGFNKIGELRIKTLHQMNGYYKKDSSSCFDCEEYLKTGDLLYYDEDFCFYVIDRIKEMFKYLSWHIVPAKLESILEKHEDVVFAAVVGIPHPEDDNHAAGVVVLQEGATTSEVELQSFLDGQVEERNKLRAGIKIIKSMPYTPTGKIVRRCIRDMIINGTINNL